MKVPVSEMPQDAISDIKDTQEAVSSTKFAAGLKGSLTNLFNMKFCKSRGFQDLFRLLFLPHITLTVSSTQGHAKLVPTEGLDDKSLYVELMSGLR